MKVGMNGSLLCPCYSKLFKRDYFNAPQIKDGYKTDTLNIYLLLKKST